MLLNLETGAYHGLNTTGSAIWKILEQEPTCAVVLDELRAELDRQPSSCRRARSIAFLGGMVERGASARAGRLNIGRSRRRPGPRPPVDAAIVERMLDAAPHRGEDTEHLVHGNTVLGVSVCPGGRTRRWQDEDGSSPPLRATCERAELRSELESAWCPLLREGAAHTVIAALPGPGVTTPPARMRGPLRGRRLGWAGAPLFRDHFGFQTLFMRDDVQRFLRGERGEAGGGGRADGASARPR